MIGVMIMGSVWPLATAFFARTKHRKESKSCVSCNYYYSYNNCGHAQTMCTQWQRTDLSRDLARRGSERTSTCVISLIVACLRLLWLYRYNLRKVRIPQWATFGMLCNSRSRLVHSRTVKGSIMPCLVCWQRKCGQKSLLPVIREISM